MSTKKEKACAEYCFSQSEETQFSIGEDLAEAFDAGWDFAMKEAKRWLKEAVDTEFIDAYECTGDELMAMFDKTMEE